MMRWFSIYLVIFCSLKGHVLQVQKKNDSLWQVYRNVAMRDTDRVEALHNIAWSYRNNDPDSAILLAEKEYEMASAIQGKQGKRWAGDALRTIGISYKNKADYHKALEYYERALTLFSQIGDKRGIGACYGNIGLAYEYLAQYPKALENQLKALRYLEEIGHKQGTATALSNTGNVYLSLNDLPKALDYYQRSLKIREAIKDVQGMADCYNNIGSVCKDQNNN